MRILFKIITESSRQALQELNSNRLRSFLSLLGVSIGIFCIIGVLSAVDSLEDNIRGSMEKLGNDVIYVEKWPWENFGGNWWKYFRRPNASHEEYEVIRDKVQNAGLTAFYVVIGFRTAKWQSNSAENTVVIAVTSEFDRMFSLEFDHGRFFSSAEYNYGGNKVIIGYKVAEALFGSLEPVGKEIKFQGRTFEVIGVLTTSGDELINPLDFDDCIIVPYTSARSLANLRNTNIMDASITVKAANNVALGQLKDEVRGVMRAARHLKPRAEDNFAINELSMVSRAFDQFFLVLNLLGIVIGAFAMLVGGVSVANIMFVSVKERTNLIGIKKAIGAKRYVILLEFLIEAIILCLFGGLIGLGLIFLITKGISTVIPFTIYMDLGNMLLGVGVSISIGIISGFIPALQAARMDPVVAMRQ